MLNSAPPPLSPDQAIAAPVPGSPPKPWSGWATLGLGAIILIIYFIAQSAAALGVILWRIFSTPGISLTQLLDNLATDGFLISVATIVSAIVGGLCIAFVIRLKRGMAFSDYLRLTPLTRNTGVTILAVFVALLAASLVIGYFFNQASDSQFAVQTYESSRWPALFGVSVVIFAPLFEEGFFRGFLFRGLQQSSLGAAGTVILTAFFWALLHIQYNLYGVGEIFVLGLVFGAVRLRTNSLTATLILHALWNLAAVISVALTLSP